ncbi:MAG: carbohydrate ABC transporter substrate-binding protein [Lachnospiraceae bacterium]|nr:carbohydrate ABC transporter substrate-binding protein [Lachnospiraceae bacterium]
MKKRWLTKACSVALVATMLTGMTACGTTESDGSSPKESSAEASKAEPVEITAMITQSRYYNGLQNMIKKLEEEENISIDVQVVPDEQYEELMKMKLNSGESADIIDYNIPTIYDIVDPEKFFADLSDEAWVDNLLNPNTVLYKGKVYGFPFQSLQGLHGFIYNKAIFEDLGLTVPMTWDEFLDVCETIKNEGDGIVPLHFPKDTWVPQIIITDNMTKALGLEGNAEYGEKLRTNQAKWTDNESFAQVIDYYIDLFNKGYVNEDYLSATYDNSIEAVGTGKAAMHFNGDFFAASVLEAYPDVQLGMFNVPMPTAAEDIISANTASVGFVAYKDSEKLDTVKKVFELWSTPEYADLYFADRAGFPAFKGVNGGDTPDYLTEMKDKYLDTGKYTKAFDAMLGVGVTAVQNYSWVYYLDAPGKGMTGSEVLEKFQSDYESYMKENNQPGF